MINTLDKINVTALLLNWQRPTNVEEILRKLNSQNTPVEIFLWNNNFDNKTAFDVDLQINSNQNLYCFSRWLMSSFTDSKYVFTLDDDLIPTENNLIAKCIDYMEENQSVDMIGYSGVCLNEDKQYWKSQHINTPEKNRCKDVDIIKGRFMFVRKSFLKKVTFPSSPLIRGDDIYISSFTKNKVVPNFLFDNFRELDTCNSGLCNDKKVHKRKRQEIVNKYFTE